MNPNALARDVLGQRVFWQPANGYRFSMDSVLLAAFAPLAAGPVCDLGAGCGVLAVLLAARGPAGPFTAVEIDPDLAECCRRNFAEAGLAGAVLEGDLAAAAAELPAGGFDLLLCNPPFFAPGSGRLPPQPGRARARHGLALDDGDLFAAAARLLPKGGRLALCWPPARLADAFCGLRAARLEPKRLRLVHGRAGRPGRLALIEAARDGGTQLELEPPLLAYRDGQEYSDEVKAIYRGLGLR